MENPAAPPGHDLFNFRLVVSHGTKPGGAAGMTELLAHKRKLVIDVDDSFFEQAVQAEINIGLAEQGGVVPDLPPDESYGGADPPGKAQGIVGRKLPHVPRLIKTEHRSPNAFGDPRGILDHAADILWPLDRPTG